MGALDSARFPGLDQNGRRRKNKYINWHSNKVLFFFTDVTKKLHFFASHTPLFVWFFNFLFFFLFHSDKRLYSTSGGEVLFTKLDQEAEMDIKVTITTTTTTKICEGCFLLRLLRGNKLNQSKWHIHQPTARPVYHTHEHRQITRAAVAAMDSWFALIKAHLHRTAVRLLYGQYPNKGETGVHDYQSSQVVWLYAYDHAHGLVHFCHLLWLISLIWEMHKFFFFW